jgi:hypothetical protein
MNEKLRVSESSVYDSSCFPSDSYMYIPRYVISRYIKTNAKDRYVSILSNLPSAKSSLGIYAKFFFSFLSNCGKVRCLP